MFFPVGDITPVTDTETAHLFEVPPSHNFVRSVYSGYTRLIRVQNIMRPKFVFLHACSLSRLSMNMPDFSLLKLVAHAKLGAGEQRRTEKDDILERHGTNQRWPKLLPRGCAIVIWSEVLPTDGQDSGGLWGTSGGAGPWRMSDAFIMSFSSCCS